MVKEKELQIIEQEYLMELQKIKDTIKQNQNKAMVIVNSPAIINNYEIGTIINERKVLGYLCNYYLYNLTSIIPMRQFKSFMGFLILEKDGILL